MIWIVTLLLDNLYRLQKKKKKKEIIIKMWRAQQLSVAIQKYEILGWNIRPRHCTPEGFFLQHVQLVWYLQTQYPIE